MKNIFETAGRKMHTLHPAPLDPLQAISYRNHQRSLTYFSHLAILILFFFTKRQNQRGGGARHNTPSPKYANECWVNAADLGFLGALDTAELGF